MNIVKEGSLIGKKIKDIKVKYIPDSGHPLPDIGEITIIMEDDTKLRIFGLRVGIPLLNVEITAGIGKEDDENE
jgi:hypothetical protein